VIIFPDPQILNAIRGHDHLYIMADLAKLSECRLHSFFAGPAAIRFQIVLTEDDSGSTPYQFAKGVETTDISRLPDCIEAEIESGSCVTETFNNNDG
jgi:hypothetical protein